MKDVALHVSNLTVHYDKIPVLWDINLDVPHGKLVGILGPNGAGKSTFIKALLGLIKPVSGSVFFLKKRLREIKGKIAYVPQKEAVDWDFPITVIELVLMGRYPQRGLFRWMKKEDITSAHEALDLVGMKEYMHRQINELSGGQQQRAFLARALLQDADIYFLDEPLSGVDHTSEEIIMRILKNMAQSGKTIFMVHHDLNNVEEYFDWIVLLNVRLIGAGPKAEIFKRDLMQAAYGKNFLLFDETVKISKDRASGVI